MHPWILVAALAAGGAPAPSSIDEVKVFAIYEPVTTPHDAEVVLRVRPDLVCRGWFKWAGSLRWSDFAHLARRLREAGILVQGGITCAAVYPGENGIDDATFRDFATRDPDGEPVRISFGAGGWHHLSLYNPRVREYLKADVRRQIDAGACGIWYDEIEGTYDWLPRSGYDAYAAAAFREWLIKKHVKGLGWSEGDRRWREVFGIDLARHGGNIQGFDYLRHLRETPGRDGKPLAADPPQGDPRRWRDSPSPLFREWGFAWDRSARGTFRFDTVEEIFGELVSDARRHAREAHGRELINTYNHNGTARRGVEFLQPHKGDQPILFANRIDGRRSYIEWYEAVIADAAEVAPAVPVVFFVDWPGEADRLVALPRSDQLHFLHLYVPEAYAAGGEFALPARGYSYLAEKQGTLDTICRMADFIRAHHDLFRGSRPWPGKVRAPEGVTARARASPAGLALHLVNHRWDLEKVLPVPFEKLEVVLEGEAETPLGAFAVSTEWPEEREVAVAAGGSRTSLSVPGLSRNTLVVIPSKDAWQKVDGRAGPGAHIFQRGFRSCAVAGADGEFRIWIRSGREGPLACLETGEMLVPRSGVSFASPPPGPIASGVVLDELGAPLREAVMLPEASGGTRRALTDSWGRFGVPAKPEGVRIQILAASGDEIDVPAVLPGFSEVRAGPRAVLLDLYLERGGWWPNWAGRDSSAGPAAVRIEPVEREGRGAIEVTFHPGPAWWNTNSAAFEPGRFEGIDLAVLGDGSGRRVLAVVQAFRDAFDPPREGDTFYACPISLDSRGWTDAYRSWGLFVSAGGERLDAASPRRAALQLAPEGALESPLTVCISAAALKSREPRARIGRHVSGGTLETCDPSDGLRGHETLPGVEPPGGPREVIHSFDRGEPLPLANWQGREQGGPVLLDAGFREPGRGGAGRSVRLVFRKDLAGWANFNLPLPAEAARSSRGVSLWLKGARDDDDVQLCVHIPAGSGPGPRDRFFTTSALLRRGWREVALPWPAFADAGRPLSLEGVRGLNLQIAKPGDRLERDIEVEVDDAGLWR